MHPDQYAKQRAAGYGHGATGALDCSVGGGSDNIAQGPDVPALENIGQRLQSLSIRLHDANCDTLAFIERVSGQEPSKPEPSPVNTSLGEKTPHIPALSMLLDRLEYHVMTANQLSHKLARIG